MNAVALLSLLSALSGLADAYADGRNLHVALKAGGDDRPGASLRFYCNRRNVIVALVLGPNDGLSQVDLAWQFDDGPTHRRRVHCMDGAHGINLPESGKWLAPSLCSDILAVRVDDTATLNFDLKAAREEITGFERDCDP